MRSFASHVFRFGLIFNFYLADLLTLMENTSQENIRKLKTAEVIKFITKSSLVVFKHEDCLKMTEFNSNSLINYTSPVSPVKVAQTKRLKKLRESSDAEDLLILRYSYWEKFRSQYSIYSGKNFKQNSSSRKVFKKSSRNL
jgi:UDP-glucose 4-epimerase